MCICTGMRKRYRREIECEEGEGVETSGYITEVVKNQGFTLFVPCEETYLLEKQHITQCAVRLDDGRGISNEQRRKIYATMGEIAMWSGHLPEEIKEILKYGLIAKTGCEYFSLHNVDMSTANEFLEYIIEFCVLHDIPTAENLLDRTPDISRYLYYKLTHKRCFCGCSGRVELHHAGKTHEHGSSKVGMGRNRKEIVHRGLYVMSLCAKHHIEVEHIGQQAFEDKYHIYGIKADDEVCRVYKL